MQHAVVILLVVHRHHCCGMLLDTVRMVDCRHDMRCQCTSSKKHAAGHVQGPLVVPSLRSSMVMYKGAAGLGSSMARYVSCMRGECLQSSCTFTCMRRR
jgi:hypothetical protein